MKFEERCRCFFRDEKRNDVRRDIYCESERTVKDVQHQFNEKCIGEIVFKLHHV